MKKGVLKNYTKFTRKHLYPSVFFNNFVGLRPATLFKKTLWHRFFPVTFVKFLRTPFWLKTSGRLLLDLHKVKVARENWVLKKRLKFCKLFLCCKLHHEKTFFIMEKRNSVFFLIFTMKLFSAEPSYLNTHSTLNFARAVLYF